MIDLSCLETIADGLAENGYVVVDDFLLPLEVDRILRLDEFNDVSLHFAKAGIGKNADKKIIESIRGDYIRWIDRDHAPAPLEPYLHNLDQLAAFVNQSFYLGLKDFEVHLAVYPAGGFYKRHLDQFKRDSHRKLSVICYLNKDWTPNQGGALRMYTPMGTVDVFPEAGKFVCFRSDQIEHEVLQATRTRISITGWLLDRR
jgi:SM-20-related protein